MIYKFFFCIFFFSFTCNYLIAEEIYINNIYIKYKDTYFINKSNYDFWYAESSILYEQLKIVEKSDGIYLYNNNMWQKDPITIFLYHQNKISKINIFKENVVRNRSGKDLKNYFFVGNKTYYEYNSKENNSLYNSTSFNYSNGKLSIQYNVNVNLVTKNRKNEDTYKIKYRNLMFSHQRHYLSKKAILKNRIKNKEYSDQVNFDNGNIYLNYLWNKKIYEIGSGFDINNFNFYYYKGYSKFNRQYSDSYSSNFKIKKIKVNGKMSYLDDGENKTFVLNFTKYNLYKNGKYNIKSISYERAGNQNKYSKYQSNSFGFYHSYGQLDHRFYYKEGWSELELYKNYTTFFDYTRGLNKYSIGYFLTENYDYYNKNSSYGYVFSYYSNKDKFNNNLTATISEKKQTYIAGVNYTSFLNISSSYSYYKGENNSKGDNLYNRIFLKKNNNSYGVNLSLSNILVKNESFYKYGFFFEQEKSKFKWNISGNYYKNKNTSFYTLLSSLSFSFGREVNYNFSFKKQKIKLLFYIDRNNNESKDGDDKELPNLDFTIGFLGDKNYSNEKTNEHGLFFLINDREEDTFFINSELDREYSKDIKFVGIENDHKVYNIVYSKWNISSLILKNQFNNNIINYKGLISCNEGFSSKVYITTEIASIKYPSEQKCYFSLLLEESEIFLNKEFKKNKFLLKKDILKEIKLDVTRDVIIFFKNNKKIKKIKINNKEYLVNDNLVKINYKEFKKYDELNIENKIYSCKKVLFESNKNAFSKYFETECFFKKK